jgi:predicted ATPase
LWLLGNPDAALTDVDRCVNDACGIDDAVALMNALGFSTLIHRLCGHYVAANARSSDLIALSNEKGASYWKAMGMIRQGELLTIGNPASAVRMIHAGIFALRSTGATLGTPTQLSQLALAHAQLGQLGEARRCVGEAVAAMQETKEAWFAADIHRIAGEIALTSTQPDADEAQAQFNQALTIARAQQAKSWELRAAMSMARLWRDQGKRQQAYDLLAPVYGWFTEGFNTLDLKQAKSLLDELS